MPMCEDRVMTSQLPHMSPEGLVDDYTSAPVTHSECVYEGRVWRVMSQEVDLGNAGNVTRDFIEHPGAVAVMAMRGQAGYEEVLVIQQYRHPISAREWEIPAGLLDVAGEEPQIAAARELYEEADLRADRLEVLLDYASSPGGSSEQLRIYLARELTDVRQEERFEREDEELDMPTAWVKLDDVIAAAMAGRIHCPTLVMGAFAAATARSAGWESLRPADAPWPAHPAVR